MRERLFADARAGDATAVAVLTAAFDDDPLMRWLFDDDARRAQQLHAWWTWIVGNRAPHVEVLVTDDQRSAAIWHRPDPIDHVVDEDFVAMLARLLGADVARRKLEAMRVIPESHPTDRHWYLAAIGTLPQHQGRGSAPRVMAGPLAQCDAEGVPAYLESSNPRNVSFYERLGFVAVGEIHVPTGPTLLAMWREPRSQ